ncbi:ubiquitin carboxyl-terminal hydrolase 30-like isoform X2, partial [Paramuricea clavata]
ASQKTWNSVLFDQDTMGIHDESIVLRSGVKASKVQRKLWSPFVGLFANQLSCKTCSYKYPVKFDSFDTVSLSLSSSFQFASVALQGLIRNFMCSEVLESFQCSGCGRKDGENHKTRLLKKLSIGKLPQCLCFHINRTYWQNNGVPYKNNTFVTFSESLNTEPYLYTHNKVDHKIPRMSGLCSSQDISTEEQRTTPHS